MPVQLNVITDASAPAVATGEGSDSDTPTLPAAIAVAVFADRLEGAETIEVGDGGQVSVDAVRRLGFEGKADQLQVVPLEDRLVYLVGLGDVGALTTTGLRRAAAALVKAASKQPALIARLLDDTGELSAEVAGQALAEGLLLGSYRYTAFKSKPKAPALTRVDVVAGREGAAAGVERGRAIATAVCRARDLVNEPGGSLTPKALAKAAKAWGKETGFAVTVLGRREITQLGLGGLLGVNRGSTQPPRFIEARWRPAGDTPVRGTVALVGKGITFDSGGLSLKTAAGMMTMKCDMAGAAAVLGALGAVAMLGLPVEVRGYIPATDNMTAGDATRPGDVLRLRNGKTIEVLNTDAEGRLILADALCVASEGKPDAIVDLATLTGACVTALGGKIAGLMGNDDGFLSQIEQASTVTGEPVWRLPLPADYRKQYESNVADMKNIGSGQGGALVAGLILQEFVGEGIPWAHLDIAGPAFTEGEDGEIPKGGTGFGVRLLVELVERFERTATPAAASDDATDDAATDDADDADDDVAVDAAGEQD